MEGLKIVKGGKLIKTEWYYDEEKEDGYYRDIDVTDQGIRHLFDGCTLADDVLLRDIFLLLHNDLCIYDAILGNWTKEYVEKGLASTAKAHVYDPEGAEYLELRFTPELEKNLSEDGSEALRGLCFPDLNAVGWELNKDFDDGSSYVHKAGTRISWSILGFEIEELMEVPVKLADTMQITSSDYSDRTNKDSWWKTEATFKNPEYTLGQILHGIMWELSFHGSPISRDDFKNGLKQSVDDIKSGKEKGISIEEWEDEIRSSDK